MDTRGKSISAAACFLIETIKRAQKQFPCLHKVGTCSVGPSHHCQAALSLQASLVFAGEFNHITHNETGALPNLCETFLIM